LLASESKAPGVVDGIPGDLDILASFADVVDGTVMIFAAVLKGDASVFWSALDDLPARFPASSGAHWTIFQLGSLRGKDVARETTFLS
jgi:hypothetical protein